MLLKQMLLEQMLLEQMLLEQMLLEQMLLEQMLEQMLLEQMVDDNKNNQEHIWSTLLFLSNGTAHFFAFSIIIEGTTEKVLQFIMPFKSRYNHNIGFIEQKMYFWMLQRDSNKKTSINWHYFCHEKISEDLFRAALYKLM
jgi:hypothetical protein